MSLRGKQMRILWIGAILLGGPAVAPNAVAIAPKVAELSPVEGQPGTSVVIKGEHFDGEFVVTFNGVVAEATRTASNQIHARVPDAASSGPVSVSTSRGTGLSEADFTVLDAGPMIRSFSPERGRAGTRVAIEGLHFSGATSVMFNGEEAEDFDVTASTQIRAVVPPDAGTGPITVETEEGTATSDTEFLFLGEGPLIERLDPQAGSPGTTIKIEGEKFLDDAEVRINDVSAPIVSHSSTSQLEIRIPESATSGPITVATSEGEATSETALVVLREIDLGVAVRTAPEEAVVSEPVTYQVDIENSGSIPATGVSLLHIVAEPLLVEAVDSPQGTVERRGRLIKADLGQLSEGTGITVDIEAVPKESTTLTNRFLLMAFEPDGDPSDNERRVVTDVASGEMTLEIVPKDGDEAALRWPAYPPDRDVESTEEIGADMTWSELSITPTQDGGRKILPVPLEGPQRFFRLRRQTD